MWWTIAAVILGILWYFHGARVTRARRERRSRNGQLNLHVNIEIRTKGRP